MNRHILKDDELVAWGIDYSVTQLDLGLVGETGRWNVTGRLLGPVVPVRGGVSHGSRLKGFRDQIQGFLAVMAGHHAPVVAYVEQPFGKTVSPVSQHLCGIIAAACADHCPTYLHSPSSWKGVMGFGTAGKEAGEDYPPLQWAQSIGLPESCDHNAADALALAAAAATELEGWVPPPPSPRG